MSYNYVSSVIDEKTHVEEPMKQVIEILVEDSPGTLADALKVFNDEVNLQ